MASRYASRLLRQGVHATFLHFFCRVGRVVDTSHWVVYISQMGVITAKALKQHTGDFIKRLRAGEPFVLTYRGKRIGIVTPCTDDQGEGSSESADERWTEVEAALAQSEPAFPDWSQATAWIRDRT